MNKRLAVGMLVFILAAGAASANLLSFRLSYFVPHLKGDFWDIEFENMAFQKSSFYDVSFGVQYETFLTRGFSLLVAFDLFRKNKGSYYTNWVGYYFNDGTAFAFPAGEFKGAFDPNHSITVSSAPLQASIKWTPLGRRGNIIPYVGGGGHVMFWNIKMQGAMIEFDVPYVYEDEYGEVTVYQIFDVNARESDGIGRVSFGWQAFGGVMIPIGRRMTVDIGGQYFSCPAEFKNAFTHFEPLDAGGFQFSLGLNYWF
ncbi:MAG TPA: hypothetical protein PLN10_10120 [Candidatus Aminicenantes bacterium]|jgi:hypothetical protein|nr:hypothetical protein [Candidatus Aminicenantes bacterium]HOS12189.1 hypothetical protein [Candidatus Aminicenantes bacterium]HQH45599.1 hypothetical protein [Candidatus Aminicenantes bacterium]